MALTEKSRSALYRGLSGVIDEEAVQEMLSFFPARDVEEPATKEFVRSEVADLRTELSGEITRALIVSISATVATMVAFAALLLAAIKL